jgi:hypothetical protein
MKSKRTSIARKLLDKRILAATNMQVAMKKLPLLCNGAVNTPFQR